MFDDDDDFDRKFNRTMKLGFVGAAISLVISLAFTVVVIWAIVQLVQWLVSK
jgi:hypothetical protein